MRLKINFSKFVWAFLLVFNVGVFTSAQTLAPGAPGKDAQWATAGKQAIGTSASLESKVWFTLAQGAMTEVYYPNVTVANVHLLQFIVVNPKTKKVETERDDATHKIEALVPGNNPRIKDYHSQTSYSLTFKQTNIAKSGDWKIIKTYITDPNSDVVLIDVQFDSKNKDAALYVYYDPSLANTGMHDMAWTEDGAMLANDGDKFSALVFSFGRNAPNQFQKTTNGFLGISDGLTQLKSDSEIKDYTKAENGNVVQVAQIPSDTEEWTTTERMTGGSKSDNHFVLALGFGNNQKEALRKARQSLFKGFEQSRYGYEQGWDRYIATLPKVDAKYQAQFNMAAMVLKASEDKAVRGANVASLTIPWGGGLTANEDVGGGYHLVWSRDLYQVVTAYMALGDTAAANRALDFLFNIQQKPDGSFPQNSWLDGRPSWNSLQLDEVAYPLILAYQLGRNDKDNYQNHVKKAADFIVKTGPKTTQERWEEKSGYSPSTIAAEIAGLVCAADIAKKNGDEASATVYLATADDWARNVERWTATTKGKYGDGNYYLRLTENGTPDAGEKTVLNNGAGTFPETEIVDAGFLELVRLGIKSPTDPLIEKSVKVIDDQLKVKTPNGEVFYRYTHDGYGEMDDGRRWNWDGKYTGKGRPWPLLTGERGEYELALAASAINSLPIRPQRPNSEMTSEMRLAANVQMTNSSKAKSRLDAMLGFANEGLMIPEQVWDKAETPANIDKQFVPELKFGEGTGSATPLAWSMAQFIRLAVNLQAGRNLEMPDVVYNRYVLGKQSDVRSQKTEKNQNDNLSNIDISEIPVSFQLGIAEYQCFSKMPLHLQECSYASTQADISSQNPILRKCKIGGFYMACKNNLKEMHACFNYQGDFKTLEIAGDFTEWKPVALDVKKEKSGYSAPCFNFAKTARVEYKIIVDGKWIIDPLNPNKLDNGVGGENSFFAMPDYKPTVWDAGELPKLDEFELNSKNFGSRKIKVYLPPNYSTSKERFPVLYTEDGTEYFNKARAAVQQENLIKAGKLKPFIIVFIDPKDRNKEYWANDDWADFVANEVVPAVDAKYRTVQTRDGRALLGASLGGVTSVWIALKHPDKFARVGGQSSSFWIDNERVVKELAKLDSNKTPFRFYFDAGTLEGAENDRRVNVMLRGKNFPVVYKETVAGHNWTAWRDRLADAFVALWK